jgi:hypothetical protein
MSRRLSAIRFAHRIRDLPDPTMNARVLTVWEGIRRGHGAPPEQAAPLMPPELFHVSTAVRRREPGRRAAVAPSPISPAPATRPVARGVRGGIPPL